MPYCENTNRPEPPPFLQSLVRPQRANYSVSRKATVKELRRLWVTPRPFDEQAIETLFVNLITHPKFFGEVSTFTLIVDLTDRFELTNVHLSGMLVKAHATGKFNARNISSANISYLSPDYIQASLSEVPDPEDIRKKLPIDHAGYYELQFRDRFISPFRLLDEAAYSFGQYHQENGRLGEFLTPHIVILYNRQTHTHVLSQLANDAATLKFLNQDIALPSAMMFKYIHNQITFCELRL